MPTADIKGRGSRMRFGSNVPIKPNPSSSCPNFVVLPNRRIVERTFNWLGRCRRLLKDRERLNRKALAFLKLASIRLMTRKPWNSRMMFPDRL
jgi:transposase